MYACINVEMCQMCVLGGGFSHSQLYLDLASPMLLEFIVYICSYWKYLHLLVKQFLTSEGKRKTQKAISLLLLLIISYMQ